MMTVIQSIIFTVVFTSSFSAIFAEDSCRFVHPKGVIDLTSLGRTDGKPAYPDKVPPIGSNYKYSYNPCKPFSEGNDCHNVAACQVSLDERFTFPLGTQESVVWSAGAGLGSNPSITYSIGEKKAMVTLECVRDGTQAFEALGEDQMNFYKFRLTHKCACWDGCSDTPTTTTITPPPSMNACGFEYPGKGVIDFSFIGRTDGKAAYTDEMTRTVSNFKYSYNPCKSFSQGTGCIGVSVCQVSNDGQNTFALGTQESTSWDLGSGEDESVSVSYAYGDKRVNISLQCSMVGDNEFQAFGEGPVNTYKFRFTHKCACWNRCSAGVSNGGSNGMNEGSSIVIVHLVPVLSFLSRLIEHWKQ